MSVQPVAPPAAGSTAYLAEVEAQRQEQVQISAEAAAAFVLAWASLEDSLSSGSGLGDWFDLVAQLGQTYGDAAWLHARDGYIALRRLQLPGDPAPTLPRRRINIEALWASMRSLAVNPAISPRPFRMSDLRERATAAFTRHVLAPARDLVSAAVDEVEASRTGGGPATDPRIIGWMRVTDGDPCTWCAMLASRAQFASDGTRALYRSRNTALFRADGAGYHDNCNCRAVPIFSASTPLPPISRWFRRVWDEAASGEPDAVNAFRRTLEAQRRRYGSLAVAFDRA